MLSTYLIAIGIILLIMVGWVAVQHLARQFALRHPEFGSYPEESGGCGRCGSGSCSRKKNGDERL
ncbi:MAG TPA: chemotaxis protein [Gammaproteobacteria bacterium]|nr:chemotaxis protein [Gammaproteobacteria bacterium]